MSRGIIYDAFGGHETPYACDGRKVAENGETMAEDGRKVAENGETITPALARDETIHETITPVSSQDETINETIKLSEDELLVVRSLADNPLATYEDIARLAGFSRAKTGRIIQGLRDSGVIERVGARKNGKWNVVKTNE